MQYNYELKLDINGNYFIEFLLENNIHGYNYYGKDFLDSLLLALKEIKPSIENEDNYSFFSVIHKDESANEEIKEKFEEIFNPDSEDEFEGLVIETIYGKILLEESKHSRIIITCENNSELIKKVDGFLKDDIN